MIYFYQEVLQSVFFSLQPRKRGGKMTLSGKSISSLKNIISCLIAEEKRLKTSPIRALTASSQRSWGNFILFACAAASVKLDNAFCRIIMSFRSLSLTSRCLLAGGNRGKSRNKIIRNSRIWRLWSCVELWEWERKKEIGEKDRENVTSVREWKGEKRQEIKILHVKRDNLI